ncbi:alpha/beta fold hydrolase [Streptomyces sp. NPDC057806]|uniref:alpha/beta fold hydrolase n=1 Tax=Streptomyces sp. NPDC057806 TaxID=3346255 RepID=UPI0036B897CB
MTGAGGSAGRSRARWGATAAVRGAGRGVAAISFPTLAHSRHGTGSPLLLLHGIGSGRRCWEPVVGLLTARHEVLAVDLPGFGDSPALAADVRPTARELAGAVGRFMDARGIETAHVAGNSLGGWVGLELALSGRVRTLSLISPAGLWRGTTPFTTRLLLRSCRRAAPWLAGPAAPLLRTAASRTALLAGIYGRPARVPYAHARAAARDMARAPGFEATWRAVSTTRFTGGRGIGVPVRVAFGSRDAVLRAGQARFLDELPEGTVAHVLPRCGHLPMHDAPEAVARFILATTADQPRPGPLAAP